MTFVDLQNPIFSYAGLYNLDAPGGTFLRDAGFDINPSKEYAVSLEPANETLIPLTGLTVEGITIHGQLGNQLTVGLELDNDNSIVLDQTALTAIIQPNSLTPLIPNQAETASSTETQPQTTVCLIPPLRQVVEQVRPRIPSTINMALLDRMT